MRAGSRTGADVARWIDAQSHNVALVENSSRDATEALAAERGGVAGAFPKEAATKKLRSAICDRRVGVVVSIDVFRLVD